MKKDIINKNELWQLHGEQIGYYSNGKISSKKNYINGEYHGEQIGYHSNGQIFYKYYYINGKFVSQEEWISYDRKIKMKIIDDM
jgi:antitoxin component YwqK of YwqJK toxin-antitoxin module